MKIISVQEHSLGAELGLKSGDKIEAIDDSRVKDIIDYRFKIADENIRLKVRQNGEWVEYDLEKDEDDDLGLEFEDMRIRKCANKCIFCFVDQNPPDMRDALYFRDGDFRMSFLHGHYITLTNMGWKELKRIVDQQLSPLYISVHVTNPDKRLEMFLYGKDDYLLKKFEYLAENGIELHSQVVLCPTWNDGLFLEKTIEDIHRFTPMARSMSIVPVGLTMHREGLPYIPPVTKEYAEKTISLYENYDKRFRHPDGSRFVVLSDEWYLTVGKDVPKSHHYDGLELEENGVGQVRSFKELWNNFDEPKIEKEKKVTIGSGTLISETFQNWFMPKLNAIPNLTVNYVPIKNELFGKNEVTVTGLLTGGDIINQLKGKDLGEKVIFSERIVNETSGERTLDDLTLNDISNAIGVPFYVSPDEPEEFFNVLTAG
jgi:putative radical SAM enzyme (TIGR03279 family)